MASLVEKKSFKKINKSVFKRLLNYSQNFRISVNNMSLDFHDFRLTANNLLNFFENVFRKMFRVGSLSFNSEVKIILQTTKPLKRNHCNAVSKINNFQDIFMNILFKFQKLYDLKDIFNFSKSFNSNLMFRNIFLLKNCAKLIYIFY